MKILFKDFVELHRGYDLPKRSRKNGTIPVIASTGIIGSHNISKVLGPGVITGRSGSIGKVNYVKSNFWPLNTTLYVSDFKNNNPKYVYYRLQTLSLGKFASGSAVPTLNRNDLSELEISIHEKEEQNKIVAKLEPFEKKIELNNQINDNLATLKTSIFDKLFKNKMSSHLNGNLSNITIITSGKRPKKKFDNKSSVAKYPIVGASKIMGYTDRYLYNESILTTGRVGTHGVIQRFRKPVWVSDNSFVFKTEHEDYLFEILNNWIKYSALNRGSTQPLITQTDLKNIDIYVPTKEEFYHFESVVTPLTDQQFSLISENDNLKKAKAALLSKLF